MSNGTESYAKAESLTGQAFCKSLFLHLNLNVVLRPPLFAEDSGFKIDLFAVSYTYLDLLVAVYGVTKNGIWVIEQIR